MATSPLSYFRGGAAILRHHNSNCFPLISQLRFQFVEPGFSNLYLYKIYLRENLIYSRINPICEELFRSNAIFFVSIDDPRRNIDRSIENDNAALDREWHRREEKNRRIGDLFHSRVYFQRAGRNRRIYNSADRAKISTLVPAELELEYGNERLIEG